MIVKEISKNKAKKILLNKEIVGRTSSDQSKNEDIKDGRFIGAYVDGKLIGVVCYYDRQTHESVHINVLKKYRAKYGGIFGKKALKMRSGKPLFTNIQSIYKDVIKYALYNRFKLWDVRIAKGTIKGKPYQHIIMRFEE